MNEKNVVVDSTDIAGEDHQSTVTEPEPIRSTTVVGALTSLPNARKADKVLFNMIVALGIKVTFEKCRLYSDLLKGRSKLLDDQAAARSQNWRNVWETRAALFNERKEANGEIVITAHMAFSLGLLPSDKRSNAQIVEDYDGGNDPGGYWGGIIERLNGRGDELTGEIIISTTQALRLGLTVNEERSNAELLEDYDAACSAVGSASFEPSGHWGGIIKRLNGRGNELTGEIIISPSQAFSLGLKVDEDRSNAELLEEYHAAFHRPRGPFKKVNHDVYKNPAYVEGWKTDGVNPAPGNIAAANEMLSNMLMKQGKKKMGKKKIQLTENSVLFFTCKFMFWTRSVEEVWRMKGYKNSKEAVRENFDLVVPFKFILSLFSKEKQEKIKKAKKEARGKAKEKK